jgi:acetyltransferase
LSDVILPNYTDPSQNYIARYPQPLDAIFLPKNVAVIGAKDTIGSVGRTIMLNLLSGAFPGTIYPVNPKRSQVLGHKCYPDPASIPAPIDLAVIVTPAHTVPGVVQECIDAKIKAAIIISAGFKELGEKGLELERQILEIANKGNLRIIGPNCLGVMNPVYGLNATFAKGMAKPGHIGFISQSGAMCTAVLDWSLQENVGFSAFVSVGSMADINWGDLINYLGSDPETNSILIYMETIGDTRAFLSAAREIALEKPIIVIKPGRSPEAAKAAASHTGSMTGSDEIFEAAMERVGVLRVNTIGELFDIASVLDRQPRPKGPRLAIITNAGGPAVLATDAAVEYGAEIAALHPETIDKLNAFLPPAWSHSNPVDILGDATPETYEKTLEVISDDPGNDGILVILAPQDITGPVETAECLRAYNKGKPILASWMGGSFVQKGREILYQSHIPIFPYPDSAAKSFAMMWNYTKSLQTLHELGSVQVKQNYEISPPPSGVEEIFSTLEKQERTLLTEFESKNLLKLYGIPVAETLKAHSPEEAVEQANKIGYPVVVKLHSETITHKTEVNGVQLNLHTPEDVVLAFKNIQTSVTQSFGAESFQGVTVQRMVKQGGYELILGSSVDPQFGPVLLFGSGGIFVEIYRDTVLGFPPLTMNLARKIIEKTKIYEALKGFRGKKAIDLHYLEELLVKFSLLIVQNRRIKECDINPMLASSNEIVALDARIVLHDWSRSEDSLPKLAIRPYPIDYLAEAHLKNGKEIILRPIHPYDEPLVIKFHHMLSEHSVRQRYFEFMKLSDRAAHERLIRICFNDFDREIAIIAQEKEPESPIMGMGRLSKVPGTVYADLKLLIADPFHGQGLGTLIVKQLIEIAKQEKIGTIKAKILSENHGMIKICKNQGFHVEEDGIYTTATLELG